MNVLSSFSIDLPINIITLDIQSKSKLLSIFFNSSGPFLEYLFENTKKDDFTVLRKFVFASSDLYLEEILNSISIKPTETLQYVYSFSFNYNLKDLGKINFCISKLADILYDNNLKIKNEFNSSLLSTKSLIESFIENLLLNNNTTKNYLVFEVVNKEEQSELNF